MATREKEETRTQATSKQGDNIQVCEGDCLRFCPTSPFFKGMFKEVHPRTIDEVRDLLGARLTKEERVARGCCTSPELRTRVVDPSQFKAKDLTVRGEALKLAYQAAKQYVYGGDVALSHWRGTLDAWLEIVQPRIHIGIIGDLVVCNGSTFTVSNVTQLVRANHIKMFGTGRIVCEGPTTFRATSFQGNL